MSNVDVVVTGATGNIGHELVERLLAKGKKVRAVGRSAEKLKLLASKGAETFVGSLDDVKAMAQAFTGAAAAFLMIPPNYTATDFRAYQNKIAETLAAALKQAKVRHSVFLSSVGAHVGKNTGPINGIYDAEAMFNKMMDLNIIYLRPVFFMENLLANLGLIKSQGINGTSAKPNLPMPMIATKDIAEEVARLLTSPTFHGKSVRELHGAGEYTMEQATKILGKALGKADLSYIQFSYEDTEKALMGMGFSADVAKLFVEMYRGFNDGVIVPESRRTKDNTTPTTLDKFVQELKLS